MTIRHRHLYRILGTSVGTDPSLALKTRRGTGYYKVPSLKGLWHLPTRCVGYGTTPRAVRGHEYGLDLSNEDKADVDRISEDA